MESMYNLEFPDFDLDVTIPNDWQDMSWKNDACPSWNTPGTKLNPCGCRVFIDYCHPEEREHPSALRFTVFRMNALGEADVDSGRYMDDFEAVLAMTRN